MNITVDGLRKSFALAELDIEKLAHDELLKIADKIVDEARNNLQNNTNIDSGTLLSSIRVLFDDGKDIYVGSDVPYAGHIEFGRGPVFPSDPDGFLHWIDKDTGKDVFAKSAKATEPSPFLAPAVELVSREYPGLVATEFENKVRRNG